MCEYMCVCVWEIFLYNKPIEMNVKSNACFRFRYGYGGMVIVPVVALNLTTQLVHTVFFYCSGIILIFFLFFFFQCWFYLFQRVKRVISIKM